MLPLLLCTLHEECTSRSLTLAFVFTGASPPLLSLVEGPDDPSGDLFARFVVSATVAGLPCDSDLCSLSHWLDGEPLTAASTATTATVNVTLGLHNYTVAATALRFGGVTAVLTHTWNVVPWFIDVVVNGSTVPGRSVLTLALWEPLLVTEPRVTSRRGDDSSVALAFVVPRELADVVMQCRVEPAALVALSTTTVLHGDEVVVTAVRDWDNGGALIRPFSLTCDVLRDGDTLTNVAVRGVRGWVHNVVYPVVEDVLVLRDTGEWVSTVRRRDGAPPLFSLTLSGTTVLALVGDRRLRSSSGPQFSPRTRVRAPGRVHACLRLDGCTD
jgi:hypothetical protein